jgi:hypothetical protein
LNSLAALVWRHCDGRTSVDEISWIVARERNITQAEPLVALALEQLGRRRLLEETPSPLSPADRLSRREALARLVLAAVGLPLIMTIATRTAAQSSSGGDQSSGGGGSSSSTPPVQVNVNVQVPVVVGGKQQTPPPPPCRQRGQSCVAPSSGVPGTCCAGLVCTGVVQNAGVCG